MTSRVPRATFVRRLRRLDGSAFAAFLADLWEARGWNARVEDGAVVATKPDAGDRAILVPYRERWTDAVRGSPDPREDATAVVADGEASRAARAYAYDCGAHLLDVDDLHAMVGHAIDREAREALLADHLGLSPDGRAMEARGRVDRAVTAIRRDASRAAGPLAALALALALVLVLLVAGAADGIAADGLLFSGASNATPATTDGFEAPGTTVDGGTTAPPTTAPPATEPATTSEPEMLAPGLSSEGVSSAKSLLAAHQQQLLNRSYRHVWARNTGVAWQNGNWSRNRVSGSYQVTVVTANAALARGQSLRSEAGERSPSERRGEVYWNGTATHRRVQTENGTTYEEGRRNLRKFRIAHSTSYLGTFLDGAHSAVRGTTTRNGTELYVVVTRGDSQREAVSRDSGQVDVVTSGYTATFLVDASGFIREARIVRVNAGVYPRESADQLITGSELIRYTDVGNATVTRPDWVDEAVNATAKEETTTTG